MKLIRFPNGDDEVLIDLENVSHIKNEIANKHYIEELIGKTMVSIVFKGINENLVFFSKDAEKVWDYFTKHKEK